MNSLYSGIRNYVCRPNVFFQFVLIGVLGFSCSVVSALPTPYFPHSKNRVPFQAYGTVPNSLEISGITGRNSLSAVFPAVQPQSRRTSPIFVGSVMALLATLEGADVLPPEGTDLANQLIHALIQLQSALLKSDSQEFKAYVTHALAGYGGDGEIPLERELARQGLTSQILEALLQYSSEFPLWEQEEAVNVLKKFNVSREDWAMVDKVYFRAAKVYRDQGSSIHDEYLRWRKHMPGSP